MPVHWVVQVGQDSARSHFEVQHTVQLPRWQLLETNCCSTSLAKTIPQQHITLPSNLQTWPTPHPHEACCGLDLTGQPRAFSNPCTAPRICRCPGCVHIHIPCTTNTAYARHVPTTTRLASHRRPPHHVLLQTPAPPCARLTKAACGQANANTSANGHVNVTTQPHSMLADPVHVSAMRHTVGRRFKAPLRLLARNRAVDPSTFEQHPKAAGCPQASTHKHHHPSQGWQQPAAGGHPG